MARIYRCRTCHKRQLRRASALRAFATSKPLFSTHTVSHAFSLIGEVAIEGVTSTWKSTDGHGKTLLPLLFASNLTRVRTLSVGRWRAQLFPIKVSVQLDGSIWVSSRSGGRKFVYGACFQIAVAARCIESSQCRAPSECSITQNYLRVSPGIATVGGWLLSPPVFQGHGSSALRQVRRLASSSSAGESIVSRVHS